MAGSVQGPGEHAAGAGLAPPHGHGAVHQVRGGWAGWRQLWQAIQQRARACGWWAAQRTSNTSGWKTRQGATAVAGGAALGLPACDAAGCMVCQSGRGVITWPVRPRDCRVSAMRARLGAGGGGAKPEQKLDATIRLLSHKEAKLKGGAWGRARLGAPAGGGASLGETPSGGASLGAQPSPGQARGDASARPLPGTAHVAPRLKGRRALAPPHPPTLPPFCSPPLCANRSHHPEF